MFEKLLMLDQSTPSQNTENYFDGNTPGSQIIAIQRGGGYHKTASWIR